MSQVVATAGFELSVQHQATRQIGRENAAIRQTRPLAGPEIVRTERLIGRVAASRTAAKALLQICKALPPVHRTRLWADFRGGWNAARLGRMGR